MMPSRTIKVTGITDEVLTLLDARIREQHANGRAEYVRELIRKDILGVAEDRAFYRTASPEQWSKEFSSWAESHKRKTPNLSDEAVSRKSIYKTR